ncbi:hypothetical protein Ancab_018581 [Ancistrocladus abbreviatus]
MSHRPKGPLEALMLRNVGESGNHSFGKVDQEADGSPESPNLPHIGTRVPCSDSLNFIAASLQLLSRTVEGVLDHKYPAYKDPHKLTLDREDPFGNKSIVNSNYDGVPLTPPLPPVPQGIPLPRPPYSAPPPPGSLAKGIGSGDKVHWAPELVEFYQTLMKREAKKDTTSLLLSTSNTADARSNMIGEIENISSFLLAVKADVETQGDSVRSLASEVRAASFNDIEDPVAVVNWLDEEISFLVDERAVLKHFDWPEGKADALREAAFEYQDLLKLEKQVSFFEDDPRVPWETAPKKVYSLLEKLEQSMYALLRTRDMAISRYREFGIPVYWLLGTGVVGKIKLSSVQSAKKYMKRVASELGAMDGPEKEPNREF